MSYDNTVKVLPVNEAGEILTKLRLMFGPKAQIQESDVRLEHVLQATSVSRRFNMQGDGTTQRDLEVYIGRNDLVVLYELKVAINKVNTAINGNNGNSVDFTYPDLNEFPDPAAGLNQSEADALQSIYAGNVSIKANTYEILNQLILRRFRIVNQTQQTATTQAELKESGFVKFNQPYILSGRDNNMLNFEPAAGADTALIGGADETKNIMVFHFKTFTVRNGAQPLTTEEVDQYKESMRQGATCGALI